MKKIKFLSLILIFSIFCLGYSQSEENNNSVIVGAIRWDAWIGDMGKNVVAIGGENIGLQVERALSPNKYHYKVPFYAKVISHDSIQARAITQEIIDQEIIYARDAGIDYWAFCWYPFCSGLETARELYLNSKLKNDINWCIILGTGANSTCPFSYKTDGAWLVNQFKESNYQTVLNGRPLVYVNNSGKTTREQLEYLRKMCKDNCVPDPYIVLQSDNISKADSLGVDAQSRYNSWVSNNGGPYSPFIPDADKERWENLEKAGRKIVPWVTGGRNIKPRIDNPVGWQDIPADEWVSDGTPSEIASHVNTAIKWVKKNKNAAEANAILIYAWNEFDEGGYICPTLGNNTSVLDSISIVIKNNKTSY